MTAEVYTDDGYFAVIPEWILDADVSAQAIRLYAVLRRYADQRTMHAHPSRRTLADRMRVASTRTVDAALDDLVRIGAVDIFERFRDDGSRASSGYLLHGRQKMHPPVQKMHPPVQRTAQGGAADCAPPVQQTAQLEPEPENQSQRTKPPSPPPGGGNGFDEFWKAYPKKVGIDAARRAWVKATRRADADKIITAVREYPFDLSRIQYVKHPATWLNAGSWEDDLDAIRAAHDGRRPEFDLGGRDGYDDGDGTF